MNVKNNIKKTFNKATESYDKHCDLQKMIGNQLLRFITEHHFTAPRIIDLGCGTGIVTERVASNFQYQDFHAIDFADQLLKKALARLTPAGINVYFADFDNLPLFAQPFDIVFSNMALHWSSDFSQTLKSIIGFLNNNGVIAFSTPLPGTLHELQPYFSVNEFIPADFIIQALQKNACEVLITHHEKIILPFNNTLSALKSIKNVGASSVRKKNSAHSQSKAYLNKIKLNELTYHIGYFVARKMVATCQ